MPGKSSQRLCAGRPGTRVGCLTPRLALGSLSGLQVGHPSRQRAGAGHHINAVTKAQGARNGALLALQASLRCKTSALPVLRPPKTPLSPQQPSAPCGPLPACPSHRAFSAIEKIAPREEATGN